MNIANSDVIDAINEMRAKYQVPPVSGNLLLTSAAQSHSEDQNTMGRLNHYGTNGSTFDQRIKKTGYKPSYSGECVAWGYKDGKSIVNLWMNDPPHRNILLDKNYTHVGIGEDNTYWTADFASFETG